jgi:hypothetical protein
MIFPSQLFVVWNSDFYFDAGSAGFANNFFFGDFPMWAIGAFTD